MEVGLDFVTDFDDADERFEKMGERAAKLIFKEDPQLVEELIKRTNAKKAAKETISVPVCAPYGRALTIMATRGAAFGLEMNTSNALIAQFIIPLLMQKIRIKLIRLKEEAEEK